MHYILKISEFSPEKTLIGGQCFRWRREPPTGENENENETSPIYSGFAGNRALSLRRTAEGIELLNVREEEIPFWRRYFDTDTDYGAIRRRFSADETLRRASEAGLGLRVLRQEPFETLISFILSQNNHIPRIRGIVERLCASFGDPIGGEGGEEGEGEKGCGFPSAERLASLDEKALAPLRAGFRARYILDAAKKVADGTVRLGEIGELPLDEGRAELKKIVGVGDKVADCVLLFGYHKLEAFPSDVWIKRIVAEYYREGLPEWIGAERGIAQQYLFEYFRNAPDD
ncbi:MAG: hypothetical protein NC084_10985 [Bacteroides sp.]|nr:DNA-3-methyladenine glycosylase 2 [Roseburia sp.]MCM1463220.1 hypothetical protein [Bacteroides sp.]